MTWTRTWKRASGCGQFSKNNTMAPQISQLRSAAYLTTVRSGLANPTRAVALQTSSAVSVPASASRPLSAAGEARAKQKALDFDTLVSVLESSATKRDARGYLQKYTSKGPKAKKGAAPTPTKADEARIEEASKVHHVAIVKLRAPQFLDDETVLGLAKTFSQLRVLGLLSVVILDCGIEESRWTFEDQAFRLGEAIDTFAKPGSRHLNDVILGQHQTKHPSPSILGDPMMVDDRLGRLKSALKNGMIPIIPSLSRLDDTCQPRPADANQLALTLTKYLTGMQFAWEDIEKIDSDIKQPAKIASVERVIILDPLGGTPVPGRPGASHRFINLEQEYDNLLRHLMGPEGSPVARKDLCTASTTVHTSNLHLVKEALSILPSTSSALITTPFAAAATNFTKYTKGTKLSSTREQSGFGFNGMVATRTRRNPLLHNLLTDKPVYSSSLPFQRIQDGGYNGNDTGPSSAATLIKRGMPLTIYPDSRVVSWTPPKPGETRLRLTDSCIDLPRLTYLIEDSFGRKLDVQDYLERVNENLAGVIIAGEYEGGAILTWEVPEGLDRETAYEQGRLVPYLDKFAVLRSRQGSGGVADIVFNAMVNDCFPQGVCWRSRKDNPVNKWYFERSAGTSKLSDSGWTMFWTTPNLSKQPVMWNDYEYVCRTIQPSWSDNKHILE